MRIGGASKSKQEGIAALTDLLRNHRHEGDTLETWLKRTEVDWEQVCGMYPELTSWNARPEVRDQVVLEAKYSGYIDRQAAQVERFQRMEATADPVDIRLPRSAAAAG